MANKEHYEMLQALKEEDSPEGAGELAFRKQIDEREKQEWRNGKYKSWENLFKK